MDGKPGHLRRFLQSRGYFSRQNLFWSWYDPKNFGDWIGPYLFERYTGMKPLHCSRGVQAKTTCLFTAGSILRHLKYNDRVTVWGSGIISKADTFAKPRKVLAVRGPLTRERLQSLGYDCPAVYGDPAVLLPKVIPVQQRIRGKIGVIPHFVEYADYINLRSRRVTIIDVRKPVGAVVAEIASCEITYSSSLHGLIVSHAFGVPSIWMEATRNLDGDGTKFWDYIASCRVGATQRKSLLASDFAKTDDALAFLPDQSALQRGLLDNLPSGWTAP
jgi:hypothetical protein